MFVPLSPVNCDEEFHVSSIFRVRVNPGDFQGRFEAIDPDIIVLVSRISSLVVEGSIDAGIEVPYFDRKECEFLFFAFSCLHREVLWQMAKGFEWPG
jgi:hypothetical protein